MEIRYIEKRFTPALITVLATLSTLIWTTYRLWPDNDEELKASRITVERTYYYVITQNGKPMLYMADISADTLMQRMSWNKDSITKSPSPNERIQTFCRRCGDCSGFAV